MPAGTKVGLNLGFFKIDYEIKMSEQELITRFLWDISSMSVLSNNLPFAIDYIQQISDLKENIHSTRKLLTMGSDIVNNLITLEKTCDEFLITARRLAHEIKSIYQSSKIRIGVGQNLDEKRIAIVNHYTTLGCQDFFTEQIMVADIYPENYKIDFLTGYGKFLGEFGTLIYFICSKTNVVVTQQLRKILPSSATIGTGDDNI